MFFIYFLVLFVGGNLLLNWIVKVEIVKEVRFEEAPLEMAPTDSSKATDTNISAMTDD